MKSIIKLHNKNLLIINPYNYNLHYKYGAEIHINNLKVHKIHYIINY